MGIAITVGILVLLVLGIYGWILDCEDEDKRLGRKPRTNFWLR